MKKIVLFVLYLGTYFGASAQTLIKDINPGGNGSGPMNFVTIGNTTLFIASDGTHGEELWKTDGTTLGTTMVMDINTGIADGLAAYDGMYYHVTPLVVMGNKIYFFATDASSGTELWSSDGTATGTSMVRDINPGSGDAVFYMDALFAVVGSNTLYFRANNGTDGTELWRSDGTTTGTYMLKNINPLGPSYPTNFFVDGNTLYFEANDGSNGAELWTTDGTTLGTSLLTDINPGSNSSYPYNFVKMGSKIYFHADNGTNGSELWDTDGTTIGTMMVKDINPGSNSGLYSPLMVYNNKLVFSAYDDINGMELWSSDGTALGTQMLKNIQPGSGSSYPSSLTLFKGKVFFTADDGTHGTELWSTDGTTIGTSLFLDINNVSNQSSGPSWLIAVNGNLYFAADDGTNGDELWQTDGTVSGTVMLNQICPGSCSSYPESFFQTGNTLLFGAYEPNTGMELYKIDLPASGINNISINDAFHIYPNPFSTELNVNGTATNGELVLYNLLGKEILRQKTYSSETNINTESLSRGIYMLSYSHNSKTANIKLVKL